MARRARAQANRSSGPPSMPARHKCSSIIGTGRAANARAAAARTTSCSSVERSSRARSGGMSGWSVTAAVSTRRTRAPSSEWRSSAVGIAATMARSEAAQCSIVICAIVARWHPPRSQQLLPRCPPAWRGGQRAPTLPAPAAGGRRPGRRHATPCRSRPPRTGLEAGSRVHTRAGRPNPQVTARNRYRDSPGARGGTWRALGAPPADCRRRGRRSRPAGGWPEASTSNQPAQGRG